MYVIMLLPESTLCLDITYSLFSIMTTVLSLSSDILTADP